MLSPSAWKGAHAPFKRESQAGSRRFRRPGILSLRMANPNEEGEARPVELTQHPYPGRPLPIAWPTGSGLRPLEAEASG